MRYNEHEQGERDELARTVKATPKPTGARIDKLRWIVEHHQAARVDGCYVDAFTASACVAVRPSPPCPCGGWRRSPSSSRREAEVVATLKMNDAIAQAVDRQDARLAGAIVDRLRDAGFTYSRVLARVQEVRPQVTQADWDDLMAACDELESEDS